MRNGLVAITSTDPPTLQGYHSSSNGYNARAPWIAPALPFNPGSYSWGASFHPTQFPTASLPSARFPTAPFSFSQPIPHAAGFPTVPFSFAQPVPHGTRSTPDPDAGRDYEAAGRRHTDARYPIAPPPVTERPVLQASRQRKRPVRKDILSEAIAEREHRLQTKSSSEDRYMAPLSSDWQDRLRCLAFGDETETVEDLTSEDESLPRCVRLPISRASS